jgi:hypothetical protein
MHQPAAGPTGRCPVQPSTPLGPDQVNVIYLFIYLQAVALFPQERVPGLALVGERFWEHDLIFLRLGNEFPPAPVWRHDSILHSESLPADIVCDLDCINGADCENCSDLEWPLVDEGEFEQCVGFSSSSHPVDSSEKIKK